MLNLGLLILRLVVGTILFAHGTQKLFGWFGGRGFQATTRWIGSLGMQPAPFWAFMAGLTEAAGGLGLALGFLDPLGSLGIIAAMLLAIKTHWAKGLFAMQGGFELPLTYLTVALGVALFGPGAYSVDALLGTALPEPVSFVGGLVLVILGVIAALALPARRRAAQAGLPQK